MRAFSFLSLRRAVPRALPCASKPVSNCAKCCNGRWSPSLLSVRERCLCFGFPVGRARSMSSKSNYTLKSGEGSGHFDKLKVRGPATEPDEACGDIAGLHIAESELEEDDADDVLEVLHAVHIDGDGNKVLEMRDGMQWDGDFWEAIEKEAGITASTLGDAQSGTEEGAPASALGSSLLQFDSFSDDDMDFEFSYDAVTDVVKYEKPDEGGASNAKAVARKPRLSSVDAGSSSATRRHSLLPELPKHQADPSKPWMQRRLAMLEAEMERIVVEQTCRDEHWARSGLGVDSVGLSSNMRDLTVFYSGQADADVSLDQGSPRKWGRPNTPPRHQKRSHAGQIKRMAKEMAAVVRRSIAADMDLKYAPRVHFRATASASEHDEGRKEQRELDRIFDQIEAERVMSGKR